MSNSRPRPGNHPGWHELPRLAEQLMAESTVAGQQARIETVAGELVGGSSKLWLVKPVYRLTAPDKPSAVPSQPASELMRRALESGEIETAAPPAIALPLRTNASTIGVLRVDRPAGQPFDEAEIELLQGLAIQAAVALEGTRRFEKSQAQAWISTVLLQVAEATQSLTALDDVLETVVRLMPMLAGVDRCAVFLWDEALEAFVPGAGYGLDTSQQAAFDELRIASGDALAFDHLRLLKAPLAVADTAADAQLPAGMGATLGFESLMMLPLVAHDEVVGAMLVDDRSDQSEFEAEWRAMIQGIAQQTATAVESIRQLEAQQEEAYVLASLLQVSQTVANFGDLDEILNAILRVTSIMVGVERSIIYYWDDQRGTFRPLQMYGLPDQGAATLIKQHYAPGEFPLLDMLRGQNDPVLLDLAEKWDNTVPPAFADQFMACGSETDCALLAVPLALQDRVLGTMLIEERATSRRFRKKRMEIITGIAQQAALAVQNEQFRREMAAQERMEQELQLAREIQQRLMPTEVPDLRGWELAATCRPALQVGGDFYDFFELPGGRLGLVIADVADKGMPAALFMTLTRTLIRAAAHEETSPAAALARANDLMVPDAHKGMFVTAVYAVLSLRTGQVTYTNAGHNPPLLFRPGAGQLEQLVNCGMALGVEEGLQLDERVVSLEPADDLVFYTDGVTEAHSPEREIFGVERLRGAITSTDGVPAPAMLDAIDSSVASFIRDNPPSDDLTLLVLRRQTT